MQLYKHNTSHDGTHKQARGRSVDATLFAEELAEIYNIPTPNVMAKAEKIVLIECSFFYNNQGLIFIRRTQI
jgi:hypothetical protein